MLNFNNPKYEFTPSIGISLDQKSYCTICQDEKIECWYNDKIWNEYRWLCLNSDCIDYYSNTDEEDKNKNKTLELWLIHKSLKYTSTIHNYQHKMILVKVEEIKINVIHNENDYNDFTISKSNIF